MAIPTTDSAAAHTANVPGVTAAARTSGHTGNNASAKLNANAALTGPDAALKPGSGTKTSAPATRASTSRKA